MSGVERVLEIAASSRVLRERRLRALDDARGAALLGREFLNLRGLAERCAAETGTPVRHRLGGIAFTRLIAVCAQRSDRFGPLITERPGFAPALASTLRDLRDAGVAPASLPDEVADLRALYTDVERALTELEGDGSYDRIGLFRLAARGAPAWVARRGYTSAEVHGATELVGSAGDLIEAIAGALPSDGLRFFQPDWANDHAERLREEWPWRFRPEAIELVADPALTRDGTIPEDALRVLQARTPREELEHVAREVLALIETGVAPREILIVARSLEPYAAWLPPIFDGYGIPVTSSLTRPAVAAPEARTWLDLVRALGRDLERAPVVRLLDRICERGVAKLAERLARTGAVIRGDADWRAALDAGEPSPELRELRAELERLFTARAEFAAARSFTDAVAIALGLASDLAGGECRAALESVGVLDDVDRKARAKRAPSGIELTTALEAALLERSTSWSPSDGGGVRILDAIQARGLPCSHLFLIGMVHGAWPRDSADDPFLPDRVRTALRKTLRRPVPIREWAIPEERFLLGLLLAQAREHVVVSFPIADGAGRALAPSGLLRDLPFAAPGTDVLSMLTTPKGDAPTFARASASRVSGSARILDAGHALLRATEATRANALPYDGSVGADALTLPGAFSPSFIDRLGRCPLQAFFQRILGARELEEPAADALDPAEAGSLVHATLRLVYRQLFDLGLLRAGTSPGVALERARGLLAPALADSATEARARIRERRPAVWSAYQELLRRALEDFLERDLHELLPGGIDELETEDPIEAILDLGEGIELAIKGQIDRIVRDSNGVLRVGDYKTGRDFGRPVNETRVKRGASLQIPLYALAVSTVRDTAAVTGEALPVPLRPERDRDGDRRAERSLPLARIEDLSRPVLAELTRLLSAGVFPFHEDRAECRYCAYTIACRRTEPASRERVRSSGISRRWFELREARR